MIFLILVVVVMVFDLEVVIQVYLVILKGVVWVKFDVYFEGGYWLILWGVLVVIISELI